MSGSFNGGNSASSLSFSKVQSRSSKRFELVTGEMLAATAIGVFLIPVTFMAIEELAHRGEKHGETPGKEGH